MGKLNENNVVLVSHFLSVFTMPRDNYITPISKNRSSNGKIWKFGTCLIQFQIRNLFLLFLEFLYNFEKVFRKMRNNQRKNNCEMFKFLNKIRSKKQKNGNIIKQSLESK